MSRDWTPREHLAAEQYNIKNGLGSIWDFFERTEIHWTNFSTERICSDEELTLRKQFPVLGKLMSNTGEYNFLSLYEKLSVIPCGIELLRSKDHELALYIETGIGNKDSALIKWFEGKLDPGFYYGEYNHHLFGESILEEAKELAGMKNYHLDELNDFRAESRDNVDLDSVIKTCDEINKSNSSNNNKAIERVVEFILE